LDDDFEKSLSQSYPKMRKQTKEREALYEAYNLLHTLAQVTSLRFLCRSLLLIAPPGALPEID
jgi:hypothetical protein